MQVLYTVANFFLGNRKRKRDCMNNGTEMGFNASERQNKKRVITKGEEWNIVSFMLECHKDITFQVIFKLNARTVYNLKSTCRNLRSFFQSVEAKVVDHYMTYNFNRIDLDSFTIPLDYTLLKNSLIVDSRSYSECACYKPISWFSYDNLFYYKRNDLILTCHKENGEDYKKTIYPIIKRVARVPGENAVLILPYPWMTEDCKTIERALLNRFGSFEVHGEYSHESSAIFVLPNKSSITLTYGGDLSRLFKEYEEYGLNTNVDFMFISSQFNYERKGAMLQELFEKEKPDVFVQKPWAGCGYEKYLDAIQTLSKWKESSIIEIETELCEYTSTLNIVDDRYVDCKITRVYGSSGILRSENVRQSVKNEWEE